MGVVVALARDADHRFPKQACPRIDLIRDLGVAGDAHAGVTVKHRSRVAVDPTQPNLRQVHLIHAELLDELGAQGLAAAPAALGENILTRDIDMLVCSLRFAAEEWTTFAVAITRRAPAAPAEP